MWVRISRRYPSTTPAPAAFPRPAAPAVAQDPDPHVGLSRIPCRVQVSATGTASVIGDGDGDGRYPRRRPSAPHPPERRKRGSVAHRHGRRVEAETGCGHADERAAAFLEASATDPGCARRGLPGIGVVRGAIRAGGRREAQLRARHAPKARRCARSRWRKRARGRGFRLVARADNALRVSVPQW
jgi:hypothetical protein